MQNIIIKQHNNSRLLDEQSLPFNAIVQTPFGAVGVMVQGVQVSIVLLPTKQDAKITDHKTAIKVVKQIELYFANAHNDFNLPLVIKGTAFQRRVWQVISAIPCGQVLTYSQIASQLGSGARAVANACGANQLPLVIPCHRVVAKNGLGGFMQGNVHGAKIKTWLLKHEGNHFKNEKLIRLNAFD